MTTPNTNSPTPTAYEQRLAANRAWKARNRDKLLKWQTNYNAAVAADPARYAKKRKLSRESYKRNLAKNMAYDRKRDKTKVRARNRVRDLVWRGKMKKQPCEVCGCAESQAHHSDYSKPLDVSWLCAKHHKGVHL